MKCSSCGAPSREDDNFCSECGARIESASAVSPGEVACRSCGASLPKDSRFCGNCGIPDPLAGQRPAPAKPAPEKKDAKAPAGPPPRPAAAPPVRPAPAPAKPAGKKGSSKPPPARMPPGPAPTPRAPKQDRSAIAPTAGWPDITEEIAEVRFFLLQGLDEEAAAAVKVLRARHPGHPELAEFDHGAEVEAASTIERPVTEIEIDLGTTGQYPRIDPEEAGESIADGSVATDGTLAFDDDADDEPFPVDRTVVTPRGARPAPHWDAPPRGETQVGPPPTAPAMAEPAPVIDGEEAARARPSSASAAPRSSPSSSKTRRNKTVEPPKSSPRTGATAPPTGRAATSSAAPPVRTRPPTRAPAGAQPSARTGTTAPPSPRTGSTAPPTGRAAQPSARTGSTAPPSGRAAPKRGLTVPTPAVPAAQQRGAPPQRVTVVPTDREQPPAPAPFGGSPPPGSTLVPGTSPDRAGASEPARLEPVSAAVAAGRVVEARRSGADQVTPEGTVISSMPPTAPMFAVKIVMLGTRGEAVADRVIEPGTTLEIGRGSKEPWGDDEYLELRHARVTPAPGGVRIEHASRTNGVFMQITERLRLRDGDGFRVGQSLVTYERSPTAQRAGPWGRLIAREGSRGAPALHPLGSAGIVIGRDEGTITFPDDSFVSGRHCRLTCEGDDVYIEDLDSSNGTFLEVRSGEAVGFGARLLMGQTQFVIRPG